MKRAFVHVSVLLVAFLLPGCIGLYDDVSTLVDKSRCRLRVGILADLHLNPPQTDRDFLKALRYFAQREVDAVVFAGDVTQSGTLMQRRAAFSLWQKVFPEGSPVARIVVTGAQDPRQVYEDLSGAAFEPAFLREVRGYAFLGANACNAAGVDAWAVKPLLAKVDKTRPFFYVQHLVPYGTCCADVGRAGVTDGGKMTYLLSKHPNAVAICGGAHVPLTDEAAFWHGDFACVHAGSFAFAQMRGEEGVVRTGVRQGLVMSVYDSSIVFERFDFACENPKATMPGVYVEKLGADWRIDLPARAPASVERPAPQFWEDTRLMILPSDKTVSVRFPPVLAKHTGVRAHAYTVVVRGTDVVRKVYSPGCCASEERETAPVVCTFPRDELPKGAVVFEVTPLDAFGQRGRTVVGEVSL